MRLIDCHRQGVEANLLKNFRSSSDQQTVPLWNFSCLPIVNLFRKGLLIIIQAAIIGGFFCAIFLDRIADIRTLAVESANVIRRRFDLRLCKRKIPLVLPCDHNTVISLLFCPADDLFLRLRVGLLADSVRPAHVQIDRFSRFAVGQAVHTAAAVGRVVINNLRRTVSVDNFAGICRFVLPVSEPANKLLRLRLILNFQVDFFRNAV